MCKNNAVDCHRVTVFEYLTFTANLFELKPWFEYILNVWSYFSGGYVMVILNSYNLYYLHFCKSLLPSLKPTTTKYVALNLLCKA